MSYEPRLISPFINSGLNQYFKPYIIGDEAFPTIDDAYPWRGSVRKREGYFLFGNIPTAPVQGIKNWINPLTLSPNLIALSLTKSYNYITGAFHDITQLAYLSTPFSFGTTTFQYYWTSNYQGSMWLTNGLGYTTAQFTAGVINGIFFLTSNSINSWNIFTPQINKTPTYLNGCLIILPYKGRLVCLNTIEGSADGVTTTNTFPNRARWGQLGSDYPAHFNTAGGAESTSPPAPFVGSDLAWRSDIPGRGGFSDADTSERIVSAGIVNDVLIVGFQRSTWRLRYTGNEILPFVWERLNTQFGAESTFSVVPFDKDVLFFSRYGWIAASTNEVQRIDEKIPDISYSFETGSATTFQNLATVQSIRDYYRQMAYWTFSPVGAEDTQIYAYNYLDKSWSVYNPTNVINCFGEYFNTSDQTWATFSNADDIWSNFNSPDDTWNQYGSAQNQGFPLILGGDQASTGANAGNIYEMFEFDAPATTDNGTPFNFMIQTKRFNPYFEQGMKCRMGYVDLYVTTNSYGEIQFQHFVDDKPQPAITKTVSLYPRGVLNITAITIGNPTQITTTAAHNLTTGQYVIFSNIYGSGANLLNNQKLPVTVIDSLNFTVAVNSSLFAFTSFGYIWSPPFDQGDARYVRIYLGAIGYHHQFVISLSETQLTDPVASAVQFEMQGLVIWTRPTGLFKGV